ncbi:rna-directed dna polymerase from mobile element jockey- hypothetical protein [Limosa lapponica baueri]|uniref:Reverse transcriptase domain-containing protein n=1 Tax=Limosa lapponica baueri TaxID=1758121 RepID=A0A2I0UJB0_LIMLA|nr:rna-directed dna polymerase from mobile element jockey- hypothetical protein [Limosa lapponica baueri]
MSHPVFKKGKKEDSRNYGLVSLTLMEVMEQPILESISRYIKNKTIIRSSQHGFTKWKSCLTNSINLYDEVAGLIDERRAVDTVYQDFS